MPRPGESHLGMTQRGAIGPLATAASVGLHIALLLTPGVAPSSKSERVDIAETVEVELLRGGLPQSSARPSRSQGKLQRNLPIPPRGGPTMAAPDTERGGDGAPGRGWAVNLASRLSDRSLSRQPHNHPEQSQRQRIRSSDRRASNERRRLSRQPMLLSFVSTGDGHLRQRATHSLIEPAHGATRSVSETSVGTAEPSPISSGLRVDQALTDQEAVAAGPAAARGRVRSIRAPVTRARPDTAQGSPSVSAEQRGRTSDSLDSTQAVNETIASLISSSVLGGEGARAGGRRDGRGAGDGGQRVGSRSLASGHGPGASSESAEDPRAAAYHGYVRSVLRQYVPRYFPSWAIAEGRGGLAIFTFTVDGNGRVHNVRLTRTSGIEEFDRNLMAALRNTRLKPPPAGPERIRFRFDGINSIARPAR